MVSFPAALIDHVAAIAVSNAVGSGRAGRIDQVTAVAIADRFVARSFAGGGSFASDERVVSISVALPAS